MRHHPARPLSRGNPCRMAHGSKRLRVPSTCASSTRTPSTGRRRAGTPRPRARSGQPRDRGPLGPAHGLSFLRAVGLVVSTCARTRCANLNEKLRAGLGALLLSLCGVPACTRTHPQSGSSAQPRSNPFLPFLCASMGTPLTIDRQRIEGPDDGAENHEQTVAFFKKMVTIWKWGPEITTYMVDVLFLTNVHDFVGEFRPEAQGLKALEDAKLKLSRRYPRNGRA